MGVGAAARQGDQAAPVVRLQHVGAMPDPVLALGLGQRVEVEQHLPHRLGGAERRQRRPPPQAARMGGVAPEIVVAVAAADDVGQLGLGIEDLQHLPAHPLELRRLGEAAGALGVARPDPVEGLRAVDVLEPEVGISVHGARAG